MKILLVVPPNEYISKDYLPPLGVGYVAGMLEKNNYDVKIIDTPVLGWGVDETVRVIKRENPDFLGITCVSNNRFNAIKIVKSAQDLDCIKILGGVHFSSTDVDALSNIPADVVVRNEGEQTMLEIVKGKPFKNILGITYRQKNKIVRTPDRPFIDINDLPRPSRNLFPISKYQARLEGEYKSRCLSIMTSRGCPYQCVFCANKAFWKRVFRLRNSSDVVDEIEDVIITYGIKAFDFWDDTFSVNHKHVELICNEIIKRELDIKWYARMRVNTVNYQMLKNMKKAGCVSVSFGVESGSPRVLKAINKNITLNQVRKATKLSSKLGFNIKLFFMHNLPTETISDVKMTIKFMNELLKYRKVRVMPAITEIYPSTDLESIAKKQGIIPSDFSWNKPYYSFRNLKFGLDPLIPHFEQINFEKLFPLLKSYQEKPLKKIIRTLKNIRTPSDVLFYANRSIKKLKF